MFYNIILERKKKEEEEEHYHPTFSREVQDHSGQVQQDKLECWTQIPHARRKLHNKPTIDRADV